MILSCPNCAARFRVPDRALRPAGRMVRCSRCLETWRVDADGQELGRPRQRPQPEPLFDEPPRAVPDSTPLFEIADEPRPEVTPEPVMPAKPVKPPKPKRDPAAIRRLVLRWFGWGGAGVAVVATAAALYFHEVMVAEVPASRPVYRLLQLMPTMTSEGLALENLVTEPELAKLDQAALPPSIRISGEVRNASWVPRTIATLEGRLYDRRRLELNRWYLGPERSWLWPGQATRFRSEVTLEAVRPVELSIRLGPLE